MTQTVSTIVHTKLVFAPNASCLQASWASSLTVSATKKTTSAAMTTAFGILFTSVPLALVHKPLALGNPGEKLGIEPAIIFGPDTALEYSATAARARRSRSCNFAGSIALRRVLRDWAGIC